MAKKTVIQLFRTNVSEAEPLPGDLADGEPAVNTADGKIFVKRDNGVVTGLGPVAAAKLVIGASTTLNASTTGTQFNNFAGSLAVNTDSSLYTPASDGIIISRSGVFVVTVALPYTTETTRQISLQFTINGTVTGSVSYGDMSRFFGGVQKRSLYHSEILTLSGGDKVGFQTFRVGAAGTVSTVVNEGHLIITQVGI